MRLFLTALLCVIVTPADGSPNEELDAKVKWLKEHAVAVRSIDPEDADFSDLMPLKELIGDSRIVQLGEQTHGDGATFYAKARLIRFLHEKMGFDVLAWESGLLDCRLAEAALRTDGSPSEAAKRGIFPIWSASKHVEPVFEYLKTTQESTSPLAFCGFDCQFSGEGRKHAAEFVFSFFDQVDPAILQEPGREKLTMLLEQLRGDKPDDAICYAGVAEARRLLKLLEENSVAVTRAHGSREVGFARAVLRNLIAYEAVQREKGTGPEATNARDAAMAKNLLWLADDYYRGRKMIVWAATMHLTREAPGIVSLDKEINYDKTVPMGHLVGQKLGNQVYTVAFVAHSGEAGNPFHGKRPLPQVSDGAIEDLLHRSGLTYALVDFRSLPKRKGGSWLADELTAGPLAYTKMRAKWGEHYDAMFFTDVMFASTEGGEVPPGVKVPSDVKVPPTVVERPDVQVVVEDLRHALIRFGWGDIERLGDLPLTAPDDSRLQSFPAGMWPKPQGYVTKSYRDYVKVEGGVNHREDMKNKGYIFADAFGEELKATQNQTLIFKKGIAERGGVALDSYGTVYCRGNLDGSVVSSSYLAIVVEGDVNGQIIAQSYLELAVTGKLNGKLLMPSGKVAYLMGGIDPDKGRLTLGYGSVYIGGRTPRSVVEKIKGGVVGTVVYLEDSDLESGVHNIGQIKVVVYGAKK